MADITTATLMKLAHELGELDAHRRDVAGALSAAFDGSDGDDTDSLLLDEAERLISGLAGSIREAKYKVAAYAALLDFRGHPR